MKNNVCYVSKKILRIAVLFFVATISAFFLSSQIPVHAQIEGIEPGETYSQPKKRTTQVTATVRDITAPSTPILIAPANDSTITTSTPSFVWTESIDNFAVSHYTLVLDGNTLFDNIPITDTNNSQYTLTYDSTTQYYTLTPKSGIADGIHTWKIIATDIHNNSATSVTWTFTIDTQAPSFVITDIGDVTVTISAQDTSTVPATAVILTENEPLLQGTGEANSTVVLTVTFLDGTTKTYTFTIDSEGHWSQQLGILPRNEVVMLDFVITDKAGYISILNDVPIMVEVKTVIITVPLIPPTVIGPIEIPVLTPAEIIVEITGVIIPALPPIIRPPARSFVTTTAALLRATQANPQPFFLFNILTLIIISTLPTLKTILLAHGFGSSFSLKLLQEIWRAIGLFLDFSPQGIVVERKHQTPVRFAQVIFTGKEDDYNLKSVIKITNTEGIYSTAELSPGKYRASVKHPDYLFPSLVKAPPHLGWEDYYVGTEFEIQKEKLEPGLVIPVEKHELTTVKVSHLKQLKWWLLNRKMASFTILTLSTLVTLLFPSWINIMASCVYVLIFGWRYWQEHRIAFSGVVITQEKNTLENVVFFLLDAQSYRVLFIGQSDLEGMYAIKYRKSDGVLLAVVDFNYQLPVENGPPNILDVTNTLPANKHLPLILLPVYPLCPVSQPTP